MSDVWNGVGDYDDPYSPEDPAAHEEFLDHLRGNPEAEWQQGLR